MITIKTAGDFDKMATAGRVVAEVHTAVRAAAKPGVTTAELDEIAEKIIRDRGCVPSFLGYGGGGGVPPFPASICTSLNEVVVHGIPAGDRIRRGDLLSVDVGTIYEGWHADAAITFAVGEVPEVEQRLLAVTEQALLAGVELTAAGTRLGDIGHRIERLAEDAGFGVVREFIGHGIGREMHEAPQVPNYGTRGKGMRLKEGMAICIEPMFNLGTSDVGVLDDGWAVVTMDGKRSAHFEHTIAVTKDGPRVLTRAD
ncbi:MAG: type I methionyl aminopeptidase [Acidimicrobiia bacterium]